MMICVHKKKESMSGSFFYEQEIETRVRVE